jgi:hypothetical protein
MQKINSRLELREAILILEEKQREQGQILKAEIHLAYESIQPINILKNTLKEVFVSPDLKEDILNTSMSWAMGFFSKHFFEGVSHSPFKKLLGNVLMFGVTNVVERNPEFFKNFGAYLFNSIKNKFSDNINEDTNELGK